MSLPDFLLEEPDNYCVCGNEKPNWALYCDECMDTDRDKYADEAIQDRFEGRRR